jgi:predicted DNA-binding helix-hairpin-helix protein
MELQSKLEILADAAKYDVSCASSGAARKDSRKRGGIIQSADHTMELDFDHPQPTRADVQSVVSGEL